MRSLFLKAFWVCVCLLATVCLGRIAFVRFEPVNSLTLVLAAVCMFSLGYRFYARFIARNALQLNDGRATPAERLRDGRDFEPTNKWILFGHHFAAIAGPGPLVGPTLAAQFGYLPGTLWILFGAVLAGAVQDFTVLFCSVRREGRTLGQMVRDEIGPVGGFVSLVTVLMIMIILLAVIGLVVVNALRESPWGTFTIAATIPIGLVMGVYLRFLRPGKVLECSLLGFVLVLAAVLGGSGIASSPAWAHAFTWSGVTLTLAITAYGFAASALPVWLLLAPRDYLSTFVKGGVILLLALGIAWSHPSLRMPAITQFSDGTGPIFAGKIFPFCLITIACGAISGFHSLISSGTTPKMLSRESDALPIGYGAMLLEGFVAIMAMIAAASLPPGVFFAVNSPVAAVGSSAASATTTISHWGFPVTAKDMGQLATRVGEHSLFARTGGAPSLALGMAQIFTGVFSSTRWGNTLLSFWYHFAIMFEALFVLTILDAGTRVGRFMLQDLLGHVWRPLGRTGWTPGVLFSSAAVVGAWGWFLYGGVMDPAGGINSLWPLFGISNQLLGTIALSVGTTILIKSDRTRYVLITLAPLLVLVTITFAAGLQKIFSPVPRIGFLSHVHALQTALLKGQIPATKVSATQSLIFNERLDALVCATFLCLVAVVLINSCWTWYGLLTGTRLRTSSESPFVQTALHAEAL